MEEIVIYGPEFIRTINRHPEYGSFGERRPNSFHKRGFRFEIYSPQIEIMGTSYLIYPITK